MQGVGACSCSQDHAGFGSGPAEGWDEAELVAPVPCPPVLSGSVCQQPGEHKVPIQRQAATLLDADRVLII